ncbi:MAG TPA: hypothetical protein VHI51_06895 [Ktedonobacterales bacterium]|nr:hypothetical protein [Ktedonobacterales bacterium]
MQNPPDPRRAPTSRPISSASGARQQPAAARATRAFTSGPLSRGATSGPLPRSGANSGPLARGATSGPLARGATSGPLSQPLRGALSQPSRLQLSGLIEDRIRGRRVRDGQRAWLVNTVVLAQALITLMVVPGYLFPTPNLPILLTLGVALVFYLAAFIFNRLRHEVRVAVYMLIGGGALATAAQVFVAALLTHDATHTAQSALLFLPIVLESGLFLAPELTLYVASATAVVIASAILLALALNNDTSNQLSEAYLVMVYSLGLDTFIGYLAWRLAQFIYETVKNAQADEDLRFAQARLSAAERQMNDQRRQLTQDVASIQLAVSSALAHEYDTRIDIVEGDLAPLAASLNLLVQQLRSTNDLERRVQNMEQQAVVMAEMAGHLATGDAPASSFESPTDSALYSVRAALSQAHTLNTRRLARLQEIAADLGSLLKHCRTGLANTANESSQAQQIAGQLVSLVAGLNETATRQMDLLAQARRALALALPPELTQDVKPDGAVEGGSEWVGLGDAMGIMNRYTSEFAVLEPIDGESAGIPPMTTPLPAVKALNADNADRADSASKGSDETAARGSLPAGLADAWLLLSMLQQQTNEEARSVAGFVHDIGILGKHVRHTGLNVDWVISAVDSLESEAEQIQQLASPASGSGELGDEGDPSAFARPASASIPRRPPLSTRPLDPASRLGQEVGSSPSQPLPPAPAEAAPGSLRISQLIGPEAFGGTGAPSTPQPARDDERPDADQSSHTR